MKKYVAMLALAVGCAHSAPAAKPQVAAVKAPPAEKPQPPPQLSEGERARRLMDEALLAQKNDEKPEQLADRFKVAAEASNIAGPARFDEAVALDKAGRTADAEKTYLLVAQGKGELAFSAAERAAALAAARGDVQAARGALGLAAKAVDDLRPKLLLAELELSAGEPQQAQAIAREVLAREPKNVRALCALARAHLAQGNPGTAKLLAARAAQADEHDAEPLIVKAEIARHDNEPAAELAAARAAVEADDESAEAALVLGRALYERGQTGEAVDQLSSAVDLDPGSYAAQLALGRALAASGQLPEAEQALARAAELSPQSADPHFELARLKLDGDGNAQAALDEAKLFLRLAPHAPPAHPIHALVQRCEEALKKAAQASVVQGK